MIGNFFKRVFFYVCYDYKNITFRYNSWKKKNYFFKILKEIYCVVNSLIYLLSTENPVFTYNFNKNICIKNSVVKKIFFNISNDISYRGICNSISKNNSRDNWIFKKKLLFFKIENFFFFRNRIMWEKFKKKKFLRFVKKKNKTVLLDKNTCKIKFNFFKKSVPESTTYRQQAKIFDSDYYVNKTDNFFKINLFPSEDSLVKKKVLYKYEKIFYKRTIFENDKIRLAESFSKNMDKFKKKKKNRNVLFDKKNSQNHTSHKTLGLFLFKNNFLIVKKIQDIVFRKSNFLKLIFAKKINSAILYEKIYSIQNEIALNFFFKEIILFYIDFIFYNIFKKNKINRYLKIEFRIFDEISVTIRKKVESFFFINSWKKIINIDANRILKKDQFETMEKYLFVYKKIKNEQKKKLLNIFDFKQNRKFCIRILFWNNVQISSSSFYCESLKYNNINFSETLNYDPDYLTHGIRIFFGKFRKDLYSLRTLNLLSFFFLFASYASVCGLDGKGTIYFYYSSLLLGNLWKNGRVICVDKWIYKEYTKRYISMISLIIKLTSSLEFFENHLYNKYFYI